MSILQTGSNATGAANIDGNYNLQIRPPINAAQAGFLATSSTIDLGTTTGSVLARAVSSTTANRLETSQPTLLFTDTFDYGNQDTPVWNNTLTTFAVSYANGFMNINSGIVTTASAAAMVRSYFTYPIPTEGAIVFRMVGYQIWPAQTNCVTEFGFLYASGTTAPTDGAFFRFTTTGTLVGVTNFNGIELLTGPFVQPTPAVNTTWQVVLDKTHAEFWINGVLQGSISSPVAGNRPSMSSSIQIGFRMYHLISPPLVGNVLKVSNVDVWCTDEFINRPSPIIRAGMGLMGYTGFAGMTSIGSTASYGNSTNPTSTAPTNTTAALGTGLGGQFWELTSLALNTDGIISSFQMPPGGVSQGYRKLIITGIRWMSAARNTR